MGRATHARIEDGENERQMLERLRHPSVVMGLTMALSKGVNGSSGTESWR
jgi:hypothetical protein